MSTQTKNPTCPECGATMARDTRPYTVQYKGLSSLIELQGWFCTQCDEAIFVGKDMDAADRELVKLKAKAEHLLSPDQVRRIRKKLALTQEEAGRILGGGPNAFHKYESAQVTTSQAISNLLTVLDTDPRLLAVLRESGAGSFRSKLSDRRRKKTSRREAGGSTQRSDIAH